MLPKASEVNVSATEKCIQDHKISKDAVQDLSSVAEKAEKVLKISGQKVKLLEDNVAEQKKLAVF